MSGRRADLKFGYDTRGLRQFAAGGYDDPELILNGLYVSDTENADGTGKDVPELQLYGGIQAFATVNLGFAEFGGGGGLKVDSQLRPERPRPRRPDVPPGDRRRLPARRRPAAADQHQRRVSAVLSVYAKALFVRYEKELAKVTLFSVLVDADQRRADSGAGRDGRTGRAAAEHGCAGRRAALPRRNDRRRRAVHDTRWGQPR